MAVPPSMGQAGFPAFMGAEFSLWGWKFHACLILGGLQAVPIVQGQILKAMWGASSWANLERISPGRLYQTDPILRKGLGQQGTLQLTIKKFQVSHCTGGYHTLDKWLHSLSACADTYH